MSIPNTIIKLRKAKSLSQEQFAELFHVSQQSVQKWENGITTPDLEKIIQMAKHFDISLDEFILDHNARQIEVQYYNQNLKPYYAGLHTWELYASDLTVEYQQCEEEGLDVSVYKDVFTSVSLLPLSEQKKKIADVLFEAVLQAPMRADYKYTEPSNLEEIQALRSPYPISAKVPNKSILYDKIYGAWMGRICGCMLGKSIECIHSDELIPFLKETGNYPMHRYIYRSDLTDERVSKYKFPFSGRLYADEISSMPQDDDTNYTVMAQEIIDHYGKDFTSLDVSRAWLQYQPKDAYCTAERVAFCNFIKGYVPPCSAAYKNPYREWIGAQIRGDYYGYINPGNPEKAAEMAFRDASISHIKNGIYGEMFVAAMLACAAVTSNVEEVIRGGLAEIPHTSRLYESIMDILDYYHNGKSFQNCLHLIQHRYDEFTSHGWCHTISNAMIVVASLLYGEKNYGKSICLAVQSAYDTDCNGATVGSILGMINGIQGIDSVWTAPIHDTLKTALFGISKKSVTELAKHTLDHIG